MNVESEIRTVMTSDPFAVKPDTLITRVIELFQTEQIHHMPVVDDNRHVVGIISNTDLRGVDDNGMAYDNPSVELYAKDCMIHNPISVAPSDTLGLVADMFLSRAFHSAPVVEEDVLVGIITVHDLVREAYGTTRSRSGR